MGILKSQLQTWSHRGAVENAKNTHQSIRNALNQFEDWPQDIKFEVYLQGSYKNHTNIRGDSDVDLVVHLTTTFYRDLSELTSNEIDLYEQAFDSASYTWSDFREDVLLSLQNYYEDDIVREGRKCLKLAAHTGLLPADIVVCEDHRKYLRFFSKDDQEFIEGMSFYIPSEDRWVVNYN